MDLVTPCYVIDLDRLQKNLTKISALKKMVPCKILLALKGFSSECLLPYLLEYVDGVSASGEYEAHLGKQFQTNVSTFSPAYSPETICSIMHDSDMVIFNSVQQYDRFSSLAHRYNVSCGIRINPEYSELPESFGANPCQRFSHLGIQKDDMPDLDAFGHGKIEGIHLHTMCAQNSDTLYRTLKHLIREYDEVLKRVVWLNVGGGQLYGADDYDLNLAAKGIQSIIDRYDIQVVAEPCEGLLTECGYLIATVLDVVHNEKDIAILDASAVCHLSDAVYRGWKPDVLGAGEPGMYPHTVRLAGNSCYAGDIFGDYSFPQPLRPGERVVFCDTASYAAVKACMFNGLQLPALGTFSKRDGFQLKKQFGFDVYRATL